MAEEASATGEATPAAEGGGGGAGGGSKTPVCPDSGCTEPDPEPEPEISLANDMQRDTIPPSSCTDPNNTAWQQLYCRSLLPDSTQYRKRGPRWTGSPSGERSAR